LALVASQIMTARPMTVDVGERFSVAEERMREAKVNSLVVEDDDGKVAGVLQIYDFDSGPARR
jgi:arabinose-5-phosphate isomerase